MLKRPHVVGMNALANRLHFINYKIPFEWLNKSDDSFKLDCKDKFIKMIKHCVHVIHFILNLTFLIDANSFLKVILKITVK